MIVLKHSFYFKIQIVYITNKKNLSVFFDPQFPLNRFFLEFFFLDIPYRVFDAQIAANQIYFVFIGQFIILYLVAIKPTNMEMDKPKKIV